MFFEKQKSFPRLITGCNLEFGGWGILDIEVKKMDINAFKTKANML